MSASTLLWGLLFSSIGIGYFIYGRKQSRLIPKYSGIALIFYPYFVTNTYVLVGIGVVILSLPFILKDRI